MTIVPPGLRISVQIGTLLQKIGLLRVVIIMISALMLSFSSDRMDLYPRMTSSKQKMHVIIDGVMSQRAQETQRERQRGS